MYATTQVLFINIQHVNAWQSILNAISRLELNWFHLGIYSTIRSFYVYYYFFSDKINVCWHCAALNSNPNPNPNPNPNRHTQSCMSLMGDLLSIIWRLICDQRHSSAIACNMHIIALTDPANSSNPSYIYISIYLSIYLIVESCQMCATLDETRVFGKGRGVVERRRVSARPPRRVLKLNFSTHISNLANFYFFIFFLVVVFGDSVQRCVRPKIILEKLLRKVNMMMFFADFVFISRQDDFGEC